MTLSQAATRISANAAAVATAMAGGTTTAEATALSKLLAAMALRPGEAIPLLEVSLSTPIDTNLIAY
jgi:hypothetical protein